MISPAWLADILAAVVIAVALFSAARLVAARGQRRRCEADADGMHVLMGIAMAGMFVPELATLPDAAWGVIFAAGAGWFGWRAVLVRRAGVAGIAGTPAGARIPGIARDCCPYPVPHLIDCLAMLYAIWAVPTVMATAAPQASGGMMGGRNGVSGMARMSQMSHGDMTGAAGGAQIPVIALILAACICGYIVWLADRIQRFGAAGRATPAAPPRIGAGHASPAAHSHAALLAPRTATWCKIAMGVAMGVMLINLL